LRCSPFFDVDDESAFAKSLDSVCREIGDRGKRRLPSARAADPEPEPEPAPAPAPAPAPVTPQPSAQLTARSQFTPTIRSSPAPLELAVGGAAAVGSFAEVISFMREEREEAKAEKAELKAELEQQRQETAARFEQQRQEAEQLREAASAKSSVSEGQLEALQARLDALHQAKLLTDDEGFKLEDCVAEFIECRSSLTVAAAQMGAAAEQVKKLVGLSEGVAKDGMLARQLRRRFV